MQALLLKFRKQIAGALVVLALVLGVRWYIHDVRDTAYNRGFEVANTAWQNKGREYVGMINDQYRQNVDLRDQLREEQLRKDKAIAELNARVTAGQTAYDKLPESKNKALDPKFVEIYNQSLGAK